jgi:hypothetical protein
MLLLKLDIANAFDSVPVGIFARRHGTIGIRSKMEGHDDIDLEHHDIQDYVKS